ncbi:hypothetical protein MJ923_15680 [Shewanella sp. 3B26]|jgi:hypothetical protein|uniref:Uncharacterized protein n=1 Tax=Shewanella zhuhaiensis TaxID=2919576 RepID=A0AAJ1EZ53_9GAMM|nr:hypothetical protein [Shewanella zhuhaiensis]MCH4295744.1 hypothetical protein [Shewanella zhuhaiensis]
MFKQTLKSTLAVLALTSSLGMASAQANEALTTELLRTVEQNMVSQTKEMLQNAALDLQLDLKTELTKSWAAITEEKVVATAPAKAEALVASKE